MRCRKHTLALVGAKVFIVKKLFISSLTLIGLFMAAQGCHDMAKQMDPDAALYSRKCSSCHNLILPSRHDPQTCRRYVEKYGQGLTVEEKQRLMYYLTGCSMPNARGESRARLHSRWTGFFHRYRQFTPHPRFDFYRPENGYNWRVLCFLTTLDFGLKTSFFRKRIQ